MMTVFSFFFCPFCEYNVLSSVLGVYATLKWQRSIDVKNIGVRCVLYYIALEMKITDAVLDDLQQNLNIASGVEAVRAGGFLGARGFTLFGCVVGLMAALLCSYVVFHVLPITLVLGSNKAYIKWGIGLFSGGKMGLVERRGTYFCCLSH